MGLRQERVKIIFLLYQDKMFAVESMNLGRIFEKEAEDSGKGLSICDTKTNVIGCTDEIF